MKRPVGIVMILAVGLLLACGSPVHLESEEQTPAEGADEAAAEGPETPAMSDSDLRQLTGVLVDLVRKDPWRYNIQPLLYLEQEDNAVQLGPGRPTETLNPGLDDDDDGNLSVRKRSRYYRRYPWKRVNRTRGSYDPDMYMCTPSRDDVIQLLVGLHRAREGDTGRTINFCNRKRPASSVFTNIRFIG